MNAIELTLTGYDRDNNNMITWFSKEELKLGDEFTLRVADVLENSSPLEVKQKMSKENLIEHKLKSYNTLKKELKALNLI